MIFFALSLILSFFMQDWTKEILSPDQMKQWVGDFNIELTDDEKNIIEEILKKPLFYLDEGGQSYVFCSSDGKYVLKFFKFHRSTPKWCFAFLPQYWRHKITSRIKKKQQDLIKGYCLAYQYLKEEAGLILLKLLPTSLPLSATVLKNGKKWQVELSNIPFAIQKRAPQISEIFSSELLQGNDKSVKQKIKKIFKLYLQDYAKGLCDRDHGVMHNVGFYNDITPIHLDLGRFVKDEMIKDMNFSIYDFYKVADKMRQWINIHFPEYTQSLGVFIDDCLEENLHIQSLQNKTCKPPFKNL